MDVPVRQRSAQGKPKPLSQFERTCRRCGASFVRLDGGASERGIWHDMVWYCSVECAPVDRKSAAASSVLPVDAKQAAAGEKLEETG